MVKVVLVSGKDLLSRLGRIVPAILPALLLSACVAMRPAGPVVPLIASDAVAAVVVDSPFGLYRALDAFWYSAGMGAAVGSGLRGFVNKNVPGIDRAVLSLDFARPWALAVLPLSSGSAENRILVYIPYRDGASGFPDKLGSKAGLRLVKRAEGYAVYATGEGDVDFPPRRRSISNLWHGIRPLRSRSGSIQGSSAARRGTDGSRSKTPPAAWRPESREAQPAIRSAP